jgi:tetratricopeptide (TPR) repeat protein
MVGGNSRNARPRCARRLAAGLFSGLLVSSLGAGELIADDPFYGGTVYVDDCPTEPSEKSIVVQNGRAPEADPDVALVTDEEAGLEPIANVSEYEPDLAESRERLQEALVPDLAEPPASAQPGVAPIVRGTPDNPISDDVCVEDDVTATDIVPTPDLQPATFSGVTPGITTRAEVLATWTNPQEADASGSLLTYSLGSFPMIALGFRGEIVDSIRVELARPEALASISAKLGLSELQPAVARDDFGNPLSTSFPERGVTLMQQAADAAGNDGALASDSAATEVYEIVVRRILPGPFILRAEGSPTTALAQRTADLQVALKLSPKNAKALHLLSEVKLAASKAIAAEQLAAHAVNLSPADDAYRLQWARCLKQLARYDEAVEQTRMVLEGSSATLDVRAGALEQMAQLAGLGSKEVQQRSAPLHNKAIELADSLAVSDDPATRAVAHQVLLEAHLRMAERIAIGDWAEKDKFVGQWISRASAIAEQMIAAGEADVSLRLQVADSALAAGGRLQPPIDPKPWIAEAEQAAS